MGNIPARLQGDQAEHNLTPLDHLYGGGDELLLKNILVHAQIEENSALLEPVLDCDDVKPEAVQKA